MGRYWPELSRPKYFPHEKFLQYQSYNYFAVKKDRTAESSPQASQVPLLSPFRLLESILPLQNPSNFLLSRTHQRRNSGIEFHGNWTKSVGNIHCFSNLPLFRSSFHHTQHIVEILFNSVNSRKTDRIPSHYSQSRLFILFTRYICSIMRRLFRVLVSGGILEVVAA